MNSNIERGYFYEIYGDDTIGWIVKIDPKGEEIRLPGDYDSYAQAEEVLLAMMTKYKHIQH